jgi:hypothetical protein
MIRMIARVLALALAAGLLATACRSGAPRDNGRPRLLILGFDGMDPTLLDRWMKAGQLPNLTRLASTGGVRPLATTHSLNCLGVAATGVNPGKHNTTISVRDTATYLPDLGGAGEPARSRIRPSQSFSSIRGGTSFWVTVV